MYQRLPTRGDVHAEAAWLPVELQELRRAVPGSDTKKRDTDDVPERKAALDKLGRIAGLENNFATWTRNAGLLTSLSIAILGLYKAIGVSPVPLEGSILSGVIFVFALILQVFAMDRFYQRSRYERVNQTYWWYIVLVGGIYLCFIGVWISVLVRVQNAEEPCTKICDP